MCLDEEYFEEGENKGLLNSLAAKLSGESLKPLLEEEKLNSSLSDDDRILIVHRFNMAYFDPSESIENTLSYLRQSFEH